MLKLARLKKILEKKFKHQEVGLAVFVFWVAVIIIILPPPNFPVDKVMAIEPGDTLAETGAYLARQKVIQSPNFFSLLLRLMHSEGDIPFGYYQFEQPLSVFSVAARVLSGESTLHPIKVAIIEGFTNQQIGRALIIANFQEFDRPEFASSTKKLQGYLFPATYFFPSHLNTQQIVASLRQNFDRNIELFRGKILRSGRSLEEVIKMASIIEREAAKPEDRRQIAGILWKRYDAGERLQVDVARETYQKAGLPAEPIGNPGLDAIRATLEPAGSPYWFYLADAKGVTHYAKTYTEHKKNIQKYLR